MGGKGKLKKWAEMETFNNVAQPTLEEVFRKDYKLKGKWSSEVFKNNKPIVLELGCGSGNVIQISSTSFSPKLESI